ncbi:MAG TPA: transcription antitermination factor NusB, partial [Gammaproteobacteria bacterium]
MSRSRTGARRLAVQALYQWQLAGQAADEIEAQFRANPDTRDCDLDYFAELLRGVIGDAAALDASLAPLLARPLEQVDPVERAILRVGAWELRERLEIPYRVVLNEAVELAKRFGAEQ